MCKRRHRRKKITKKYRQLYNWVRKKGGSNQHAIIAKSLFPGSTFGKYKQYGYGIRNKYGIAPRKSFYIHK